ncbi:MAG: leucine-rich repeat domain-containing protein [SAR324 cluster bacterium]|nr:leucine-rich repeat domain-containing protein [SAR324 cluster bacterium]
MTNLDFLNASALAEKILVSFFLFFLGAWLLHTLRKNHGKISILNPSPKLQDWLTPFYPRGSLLFQAETALTPSREFSILFLIISGAGTSRLIGWDQALNAPNWFAQVTPLHIAKMMEYGDVWQQWLGLLNHFQITRVHQSPLLMPVAMGIQWIWGAAIHLPVLVGSFWGMSAIVLAWLLGRSCHSKIFGLLFSALLAVSPLQIVWSRTGGIFIGATTHILLVIWLSYHSGKHKSHLLMLLAGIAAWGSLYQYYAARVALPLAFIALFSGLHRGRSGAFKKLTLFSQLIIVLYAAYLMTSTSGFKETIWPDYGSYAGNRGEKQWIDYVTYNIDSAARELKNAFRLYFLNYRSISTLPGNIYKWGMESGGICFAPVALLGIAGLWSVVINLRREFLWLFLFLSGLALPALSVTTPRRLLTLDLGWCALAAHGVIFLLNSRIFRTIPLPHLVSVLGIFFLALGAWSFSSIVLLNKILPDQYKVSIPFGDVFWFRDGQFCRRCLEAGKQWETQIKNGSFVILVDSDLNREGRTIPGGLPVYGKLAALVAGKNDHFLEFYAVLQNYDQEPPTPGIMYDDNRVDFVQYIDQKILKTSPNDVIWHFEQPTQWERWLARRLTSVGGFLTTFRTPTEDLPAIQIQIPTNRWGEVKAILKNLDPEENLDSDLLQSKLAETIYPSGTPLFLSLPPNDDNSAPPEWFWGTRNSIQSRAKSIDTFFPVGLFVDKQNTPWKIHVITREAFYLTQNLDGLQSTLERLRIERQIGLGCSVFIKGYWWFIDSTNGALFSTSPHADTIQIPRQDLIGIKLGRKGELLLASASQRIYVYDLEKNRLIRDFPAAVWPSRITRVGECAPLLTGEDWYATYNHFLGKLYLYDTEGNLFYTPRLDQLLGLEDKRIISLETNGSYMGVGLKNQDEVRTYKLRFKSNQQTPVRIPDPQLETCLKDNFKRFNTDKKGISSQAINLKLIEQTEILECETAGISDVNIIRKFRFLQILNLSGNQIKKLDLSGLADLRRLLVGGNQITEIQGLTDLKQLKMLWLGNNQLTSLNLTGLTELKDLRIDVNQLTRIEGISSLINLKTVFLGGNPGLLCKDLQFPNSKTEIHGC